MRAADIVTLVPQDPCWAAMAKAEAARLASAVAPVPLEIHHIGSTAIPGVPAKPIVDLLGVAPSLAALDRVRDAIEALGYDWRGEYGLVGRRYCTLSDPETGVRRIHLHAYGNGAPSILRHLAFRDHLRANPALAADYAGVKARCAARHPFDGHAYTRCKSAWIARIEAQAIRALVR